MTLSYCLHCHEKTNSRDAHHTTASNGRSMIKSKCAVCGTGKCKFAKEEGTAHKQITVMRAATTKVKKVKGGKHGAGLFDYLPPGFREVANFGKQLL